MRNSIIAATVVVLTVTLALFMTVGCSEQVEPAAQVEEDASEFVQTICPVMNVPIDENIYVDHEGQRVYFCCAPCIQTFEDNPDEYLAKIEEMREAHEKGQQHDHDADHDHHDHDHHDHDHAH